MHLTFLYKMCRNCTGTYRRHQHQQQQMWPEDGRQGDVGEFSVCFGGRRQNILSWAHAAINLSREAKGTFQRLKSPRTTQLLKIELRDGIVVTGTTAQEQIYNLISDNIRTHIHTSTTSIIDIMF